MYSKKFFDIHFHELKIFFKSLCPWYTGQFFGKVMAYKQYNFHLKSFKFLGGHGFNIPNQKTKFRGMRTDLTEE